MINALSVVEGLQNGDEGKSAVIYELHKNTEYTHSIKVGGGSNRGGTIYHNGIKYIAQQIPIGVFFNKPSIIGPGCVLNIDKLFKEIKALESLGLNVANKILIANNVHIVTDRHIAEESNETTVGTTKQGIGPCYRDKYSRTGIRAESIPELKPYLIDMYDYFYNSEDSINLLCECAQGFNLDIDHGNYPYVTSSQTTVAGALQNGFPWNKIHKVYGCAKAYDTYVGSMKFQPLDTIFDELCDEGQERGCVTGRRRQCNWLNISSLIKAIHMNGVTHLIISKLDVLRELNNKHNNQYWNLLQNGLLNFRNEAEFKTIIEFDIFKYTDVKEIQWRNSPTDGVIK